MKKILILVSLVALVASGLFADVSFTGKLQTAAQQPADSDNVYKFKTDNKAELQANIAAMDDATTGVLKIKYGSTTLNTTGSVLGTPFSFATTGSAVVLDRAHFTTSYLKAFGLGMDDLVAITGNYGYNEFAIASVANVTSYDTAKKFSRKFTVWGTAQAVEVLKMVKLTAALDLGNPALVNFFVDLVATIPNAGPGTAKAEVAYVAAGVATDKYGEGSFIGEAAYEMTGLVSGLTVAPGVGVEMKLKDKADDFLTGGVKVAYDTDLFGVYIDGGVYMTVVDADEAKGNNVTLVPIALGASYSKMVGLDLGVYLDLSAEEAARGAKLDASGAQGSFDSLDVSLWVKTGTPKLRLGYFYVPDKEQGLDTLNAVNADGPSKGLYFAATLEF